jgi:membrane associated rhomboid family serine protease
MKIKYNSPVVLSFVFICAIILIFDATFFKGLIAACFTAPGKDAFNPHSAGNWLRLVTHVFGHASVNHLVGNLLIMLIVGPMLESIYGSLSLVFMMLVTAFVTGLANILFFSGNLLGASGIVFMMILLASFTNFRKGEIPLTFILVLIFYVGNEFVEALTPDSVAHFAHIIGGFCGSIFGFFRKMPADKVQIKVGV